MNRLVAENPTRIAPESLPPMKREPGRSRLLFITSYALGFRTLAKRLEDYTQGRDDVDAVHLRVSAQGWRRYVGAGIGALRGWDLGGTRSLFGWKLAVNHLIAHGLDPRRFDAALITTQTVAPAMIGVRRRTGLPFAVYVDATNAQYCRELGGNRLAEAPVRAMERRIFNTASFVAGMSNWTLDSVAADYTVPRDRLQLVRNAVPIPPLGALPEPATSPTGKARIAFVGNDWLRKGGDRLVAWHQARWTDRAELHIISSTAPVDASARSVVWHGSVPNERLMGELLPSMDFFALPTRQDMSPWAAIEAASIGLPVVSSRIGGLGEIVLHGKTGLLCPPNDDAAFIAAIERLMADPALRRTMSAAARTHMLAEFSPDRCYGGLVDRLASLKRG